MGRAALITSAAVAALLASCASMTVKPKSAPASATLAAHGVECHSERTTGTLIAATVCTTPAERKRQADNAQQTKDVISNPIGGPCPPPNVQCH
jgi:hypothetical protein